MFENLKKKLKGIFSKGEEQIEAAPTPTSVPEAAPEPLPEPALPPAPPAPEEIPLPPIEPEKVEQKIPTPEEEKEILAAVEKGIEKVEIPLEEPVPEEAKKEDESDKQLLEEVKKELEKVEIPPPPPVKDIEKEVEEIKKEIEHVEKEEKVSPAPLPKEEKLPHLPEKKPKKEDHKEKTAPKHEEVKPHTSKPTPPAKEIELPPQPTPKKIVQELEGEISEKEERPGFFKLFSKITHKELTEKDIDPILWELEVALLENDVAKEVSEKIIGEVKQALISKKAKRGSVEQIINDALKKAVESILGGEQPDVLKLAKHKKEKPFVIMFFGFNGTGKTMTIGKFAKLLQDNKISVVMAAGDTFRAAAIEQLEVHATNLNVPIIKQKKGADSAAVIFDAIKHAKAKGIDVVLADTAGRSHTNANLMDELKKIVRVSKPDLKVFVGDSLTGNDAAEQAKMFNDAVGIDASVLTKVDTDPKGGACLSVAYVTDKPILYLGTGQNYADMIPFSAKWFVEKIF